MDKLQLIKYLSSKSGGSSPSASTVADHHGVEKGFVNDMIERINQDRVFYINKGKGGGLRISSAVKDEKDMYDLMAPHLSDWIINNIYGRFGVTHNRMKRTHLKKLNGKWSTPDFSLFCIHKYMYTKAHSLEITTVEASLLAIWCG